MIAASSFTHAAAGVDWYCEMRGSGPAIVLIPSGEGDCASFERVAARLADRFRVLTFDTPGFSRSGTPSDPASISMNLLADQIAELVRSLGIERATFYGCSSGGRAVLDLVAEQSRLVRNGILHEAALASPELETRLARLAALDDATAVAVCKTLFGTELNEDEAAWNALGSDYHARLERNYATWVRRYLAPGMGAPVDPAALTGRPLTWTVGALSDQATVVGNLALAAAAGLEVGTLPCLHFPQVSIPERLAAHIASATAPWLD